MLLWNWIKNLKIWAASFYFIFPGAISLLRLWNERRSSCISTKDHVYSRTSKQYHKSIVGRASFRKSRYAEIKKKYISKTIKTKQKFLNRDPGQIIWIFISSLISKRQIQDVIVDESGSGSNQANVEGNRPEPFIPVAPTSGTELRNLDGLFVSLIVLGGVLLLCIVVGIAYIMKRRLIFSYEI